VNQVIVARHLGKSYPIYQKPSDKLMELLGFRGRRNSEFWALKDVNLDVPKSCTVGVIGQNGSGKSTLLQIIAGLLRQSRGELRVYGKVSALLELGAGFNPEFSGRDNVYMNAAILGLSQSEIDHRFPKIANFAEIGDFLERPVKTYSSGMYLRLAFSTAIHVDPEILLVDEALAVGDLMFQHRCMHRINQLRDAGVSVLLVSHDLSAITRFCSRCLLLDHGEVLEDGRPDTVVQKYRAIIFERERQRGEPIVDGGDARAVMDEDISITPVQELPNVDHRFGDGRAEICGIDLLDGLGRRRRELFLGEPLCVRISALFRADVETPIIGFTLRDRLGVEISATNTSYENKSLPPAKCGETCTVDFRIVLPELAPGGYSLSPAVACGTVLHHEMCDWVDNALHFTLMSSSIVYGLFRMNTDIRYRVVQPESNV
jgi:ABC-type polysaccharide/polyol phosphate transport system ATPase subunit